MVKHSTKRLQLINEGTHKFIIKKHESDLFAEVVGIIVTLCLLIYGYFKSEETNTFTLITGIIIFFILYRLFKKLIFGDQITFDLKSNKIKSGFKTTSIDDIKRIILDTDEGSYELYLETENGDEILIDNSDNQNELRIIGYNISKSINKKFTENRSNEDDKINQKIIFNKMVLQFEKKYLTKKEVELRSIIANESYANYARQAAKNLISKNKKNVDNIS